MPGGETVLQYYITAHGQTQLHVNRVCSFHFFDVFIVLKEIPLIFGGGRVVRRCWVNFQCRGVLLTWITLGQGPIVLAVGAGGCCLDIFSLIFVSSSQQLVLCCLVGLESRSVHHHVSDYIFFILLGPFSV